MVAFNASHLAGIIVSLITLPFILMLLVPIYFMVRGIGKGSATKTWPVANGRIISSVVSSHRSAGKSHMTIYSPEVVYSYEANGQQYQSSQLNYSMISGESNPGWAESIAAKYPAGSGVQVFYNPQDPTDAVLEHVRGGSNIGLMLTLIFIEVLLIGLLVLGLSGHLG